MEDVDPLEALSRASDALQCATRDLDAAVLAARNGGASWATIGNTLGITRQSAHERWGHLARGECRRDDCDCPHHLPHTCPCGHSPA